MEKHLQCQWIRRSKRSKRSPEHTSADEYSAAEALILLSNCDGGFCPVLPAEKLPEAAPHAAVDAAATAEVKTETSSPDTPLPSFHPCWMCGMVFRSHQSLGGHMTSHRETASRGKAAAVSGGVHECGYCHKRFATGQALGGHKRKHYRGPKIGRRVWSVAGESIDGGSTSYSGGDTKRAAVLEFDLNLPALECGDDDLEIVGIGF